MKIQTSIPDDEMMDDCVSLTYSIEFGELHERDKLQWIEPLRKQQPISKNRVEYDDEDEDIIFKKIKFIDFEFKMNHIKQTIKIEITANYKTKQQQEGQQKSIFCGFYSFARCIRKSGCLVSPNQIGHASFEDISVQVSLSEKLKYGGYRCITLRVHDTKGGDFVENPDLTMIVCEANRKIPLAEISKEIPLITSPEGLYKRIDIGVNNYDPQIFMMQDFQVYFLKDSYDYADMMDQANDTMGGFQPMGDMRSDADIFQERIERDLVAFGNFSATDIINHSTHQEEFTHLEPGLFD